MKTLLPILLLGLVACTYEPEETYFKEITLPVIEGTLSIDADAPNDTILIYNPTTFSIDFNVSAGRVERVEVEFDGQQLTVLDQPGESFTIDGYRFRSGVFNLMLIMQVNPQTGSIANHYGGERTIISRAYKLKIDADPPADPVVTSSSENGFLKISWTPYTKPNFVSYRVSIQAPNKPTRSVTITNAATPFFIDSTYVGGANAATSYYVYTNAIGSSIEGINVSHPMQFTQSYNAADSMVTLRWRKMPFANAFKEYLVKENNVERIRISNIADTIVTFKVNAILNMGTTLQLQTFAKYELTQYAPYTHQLSINNTVRGLRLPSNTSSITYNETLQSFFGRRPSSGLPAYTVRFDQNFIPLDSINITGVVPFKGSHLYYGTQNTVNRRGWFSGVVESADISPIVNVTPSITAASSTGMVVASWQIPRIGTTPIRYFSRLVNIPDGATAWEVQTVNNSHSSPTMSTNAKYIRSISQGIIGRLDEATYTTFATFSSNTALALTFRPDDEEELIQTNHIGDAPIYNTDLTLNRTMTPPELGYNFESYDPVSKFILFSKNNSTVLYAIHADMGEVRTISAYKGSVTYRLLNGYLFSGAQYFKIF